MAAKFDLNSTYESMCDYAREQSLSLGRYAAVVEVTHYMQSQRLTTVMVSTTPIKSFARGPEFVGLMAQYRNGLPYGDGSPVAALSPITNPAIDSDELPF